jgi:hypothetical protein
MPNSPWTETGSSISLVPSTTTIGSDPENVNYLSNQDKINLMAQYTAELAMKTSLDTLASTWRVSSTFYDNAVAAISTALINAGAPSNWATTWPDGTTSGPWPGIQTSLANLWAQVATQRTALQSSVSASQAAAAQAAAISTAVAQALASAPVQVSSLPTLPNAAYPAGRIVWNTADGHLYISAGSTWTASTVAAANISGTLAAAQVASLAASQITGAVGSSNQCANSDFMVSSGGVPTNFNIYNNGGISITPTVAAGGAIGTANYWRLTTNAAVTNTFGFYLSAGSAFGGYVANTNYVLSFYARASTNPNALNIRDAWNRGPAVVTWLQSPVLTTSWQRYAVLINFGNNAIDANGFFTVTGNMPSGVNLDFSCVQVQQGDTLGGWAPPSISAANPIMPANVSTFIGASSISTGQIAANTITATNIAAGAITATQIAAQTITAGQIAAGTVTSANIAAGTIQASNIAAATITGGNIAATTITGSNIAADTITAAQIAAGAITASELAAGSVTTAALTAGCVTAGNIASGAITANMITTGTLNAANVAVTNLNASNITTGTLSANMVLFPDGTELSTANRVVTMFKQPSSDNIAVGSDNALIPGLSWPVTVHSGADVFNFFGALTAEQTSGAANNPVNVYFYVDGVFAGSYPCVPRFPTLSTWYVFPIAATVSGLTTGAHTIAIYANNNGYPFTVKAETRVTCQQIY